MGELKHGFGAAKMNKDADERTVPNGEYRDALNIQVDTSESGEVGTIQNILGNSLLNNASENDSIPSDISPLGFWASPRTQSYIFLIKPI